MPIRIQLGVATPVEITIAVTGTIAYALIRLGGRVYAGAVSTPEDVCVSPTPSGRDRETTTDQTPTERGGRWDTSQHRTSTGST
jgi:hypothetical protein